MATVVLCMLWLVVKSRLWFYNTTQHNTNLMLIDWVWILLGFVTEATSHELLHTCLDIQQADACQLAPHGCLCDEAMVYLRSFEDDALEYRCNWTHPYPCADYPQTKCMWKQDVLSKHRLEKALSWLKSVNSFQTSTHHCFPLQKCIENITQTINEQTTLYFPYGMGLFRGREEICEFIGLSTLQVSKYSFHTILRPRLGTRVHFHNEQLWVLSTGNFVTSFMIPHDQVTYALVFTFQACTDVLESIHFQETSETSNWLLPAGYYMAVTYSQFPHNFCEWMTELCPSQWTSMSQCLKTVTSLPHVDPACGNDILSGTSKTSALKRMELAHTHPTKYCSQPFLHQQAFCNSTTNGTLPVESLETKIAAWIQEERRKSREFQDTVHPYIMIQPRICHV